MIKQNRIIMTLILLSCVDPVLQGDHLPGHSECQSERMEDEVCLAVVEEDPRLPTESINQSNQPLINNDPRLQDDDYIWLTEQVTQCTCVCCHSTEYQGPGTYFWDIDFQPVWIDSANSWSLIVLAGETNEPSQTLPSDDPERVLDIINKEINRRNE
jgi:hypothetical protein